MAHDCYDDCIAFLDDQLGQLVDRLKGMGLLENTVVIVASDHGEGFFDHGTLLHGNSLFLEEIAVPLVILAPNAPAGRVVSEPVSLRDLPATVIDQLGLSAGSPLPGHSLAACWTATPDQPASIVTPAFSEFTTRNVFEAPTYSDLRRYGVQMSLVAAGKHYLRDGFGTEELYDLKRDPLERENLAGTAAGKGALGPFRKMLLDELNASPGAIEVENTYMKAYRQWLKSVVE
jgi:arylsulfatase A-like enzyme